MPSFHFVVYCTVFRHQILLCPLYHLFGVVFSSPKCFFYLCCWLTQGLICLLPFKNSSYAFVAICLFCFMHPTVFPTTEELYLFCTRLEEFSSLFGSAFHLSGKEFVVQRNAIFRSHRHRDFNSLILSILHAACATRFVDFGLCSLMNWANAS